jgi:hypothetical protein
MPQPWQHDPEYKPRHAAPKDVASDTTAAAIADIQRKVGCLYSLMVFNLVMGGIAAVIWFIALLAHG